VKGSAVKRTIQKGTAPTTPPQTVAEVPGKHVVPEVESIDRMYFNVIVGRLQILAGALRFIRQQGKAQVLKFCSYFPYNAKLCLNGHEYAKRPIPIPNFHPTDRTLLAPGFGSPGQWKNFLRGCDSRKPDIGRPKQIQLIFDRWATKATQGSFRTRVITDGLIPSLHIDHKGTRIKQYHKEGQALCTETTINNTRDFYIGKSPHNLPALRKIGFPANRRRLETESITHDSTVAEETFQQLNRPHSVDEQRVSALRFADPMIRAVWNALLVFDLLPAGFPNRQLCSKLATLRGQPTDEFTRGRMSYQFRRLRLHGLIERIPKTHRYRLTSFGFRVAVFRTPSCARILRPGLGLATSSFPSALRRSFQ
jgi:hypothetical protein